MPEPKSLVCVAWHNPAQIEAFLSAWKVEADDPRLILQQDKDREGCARTKNKAVQRAVQAGAEVVVVLDDDCYPDLYVPSQKQLDYLGVSMQILAEWNAHQTKGKNMLGEFIAAHLAALEPQPVERFAAVTTPRSRGTPYGSLTMKMPVAASMGFWTNVGDRCGVRQLADGANTLMEFDRRPRFQQYFAWSGMNCAFRAEHAKWFQFIDVPRFDDIWCGWIAQRHFYDLGYCFALNGPLVKHSRQSNVWQNLRDEAKFLEQNETLWQKIAQSPGADYETLRQLLPV